jgi:hypothetical protein
MAVSTDIWCACPGIASLDDQLIHKNERGPTRETNQPRGRISDMLCLVHFWRSSKIGLVKKDSMRRADVAMSPAKTYFIQTMVHVRELDAR